MRVARLTKHKEYEPGVFQSEIANRRLLFHGTKTSSLLSILAQGLQTDPPGVARNGQLLGRGIYFTDMAFKSLQYTAGQNSRFVLVCEVALGKVHETTRTDNNFKLPEGFDCVLGQGKRGPELEGAASCVTMPDGAAVPIGKAKVLRDRSDFQYNEFVVPDSAQVRLRYLLQYK